MAARQQAAGRSKSIRGKSDAHWHDDILELVVVGSGKKRRRVHVGLYRPPDLLGLDVGKNVEQVADVETDVQRLVAVVDVDFFLRFFLFGVGRCNFKLVVRKLDAHALELVGGKNGGALQAALQDFAIDLEMPRVIGGYDPGEV